MSKKKNHKKNNRKVNPDRNDWLRNSEGIPVLQSLPDDTMIDVVLKPREKVSIPLSEYRTLVEAAFALKIIQRGVERCKYSSDIETLVKTVLGDSEKKDGDDNG